MHVVLDGRSATPHFPGIGRYVRCLLNVLPEVLSPDERLTALRCTETAIQSQVGAAPARGDSFSIQQQWSVPRALRRIGADVYHSTYYAMPYRPGVPTVLTVYDLIPLRYPEQVSTRARWLFSGLMRLALGTADHVLAISEATCRDVCQYFGIAKQRVTVTPLAAGEQFRPYPNERVEALRKRLALPACYVLYVGSNKPHKNLVRLVEAWSLVVEVGKRTDGVLVVAGPWDERYPEAKHRVRQLALGDHVQFIGRVDENDLPVLYNGAEVFVFPSLYEGFGLPVLEAMACGVPVACSDTSSLPEVGGTAARYFNPLDVDDMAATLRQLLDDEVARVPMKDASQQQAARFSWTDTARHTLAVYRDLAQQYA